MRTRARGVMVWATLAAACDASSDPAGATADDGDDAEPAAWGDPQPLVTAAAWAPAPAERDPFADERPATVECPVGAWGAEWGGLEVQTGACNYLFVDQPSRLAIAEGDALDLVVFHQDLDAPEPAEGHVAILVGDEVVWEAHVEIPADASVLEARVVAERAWPAGTPVGVHLHNHGYNSWTVLELSVAPREPSASRN